MAMMQVYCGGDFGFMAKLSKYLPIGRPATFLDAGANIGMATLLFSQLIMGNGQVLSVEANPETAQVRALSPPRLCMCVWYTKRM